MIEQVILCGEGESDCGKEKYLTQYRLEGPVQILILHINQTF